MIGPGLPHDRPPLSKRALATGRLPLLATAEALAERGITHVDGVVTHVDLATRRLTVQPDRRGRPDRPRGAPARLGDGAAVSATARARPRPAATRTRRATACSRWCSGCRTPGRRVVVIGAGLIGTETAATLAAAHDVTLLDMLDRPLARFLPVVSDAATATLAQLGVTFAGECRIEEAVPRGDGWTVRTSTHGDLPCDVDRVGRRLPLEPAARARRGHPAAARPSRRRDAARPATTTTCGRAATACRSRTRASAGSRSRTGITRSGAGGTWRTRSAARASRTCATPTSSATSARCASSRSASRAAPCEWAEEDALLVGRDEHGAPACVLLIDAPARLGDARKLVATAA